MTEQEQRVAIAEACGWAIAHNCKNVDQPEAINVYKPMIIGRSRVGQTIALLPDYCNDLNAMHEAEKVLGEPLCYDYVDRLPQHYEGRTNFALAHATAAQRSEAFLKTLNLWK